MLTPTTLEEMENEECEKTEETQEMISIPMEEYKELLMIKGRYEELKLNTFTFKPYEPIQPATPYNPANPFGTPIITYCSLNERK